LDPLLVPVQFQLQQFLRVRLGPVRELLVAHSLADPLQALPPSNPVETLVAEAVHELLPHFVGEGEGEAPRKAVKVSGDQVGGRVLAPPVPCLLISVAGGARLAGLPAGGGREPPAPRQVAFFPALPEPPLAHPVNPPPPQGLAHPPP